MATIQHATLPAGSGQDMCISIILKTIQKKSFVTNQQHQEILMLISMSNSFIRHTVIKRTNHISNENEINFHSFVWNESATHSGAMVH